MLIHSNTLLGVNSLQIQNKQRKDNFTFKRFMFKIGGSKIARLKTSGNIAIIAIKDNIKKIGGNTTVGSTLKALNLVSNIDREHTTF